MSFCSMTAMISPATVGAERVGRSSGWRQLILPLAASIESSSA
jgi:hypothetical protein